MNVDILNYCAIIEQKQNLKIQLKKSLNHEISLNSHA